MNKFGIVCLALILATFTIILTACNRQPPSFAENESLAAERILKTDEQDDSAVVIITNVVRVFMHDTSHFSVVSQGGKSRLVIHDLDYRDTSLYCDVPDEQTMWAVYDRPKAGVRGKAEIHLHNSTEINGAGWISGGKSQRRGTTTVIE